ncbi:MAG: MFS transporter, partial [Commensalibacter sp.]|nr:MFS transporter [Commensalibacter sp.]
EEKHKAISTILLAGVIGVLIGPSLFNRFISNSNLYSIGNAYLTTMLMGLLVFLIILCLYHETSEKQNINPVKIPKRPFIFQAIKQPIYVAAVSVNAISYAVMMFAMTATPIAMMKTHHDIHYSTSVIQLHMIGMFATSFITGKLISRWGKSNVIFIGIFFNVLCALIMIFLQSVLAFFIALLFLGIGWNLMFISGSALLARSYDSDQKYAMQSIAEFITFTFSGIGALSAGWVLNTYSWTTINLCILPLLAIPVITTLYYRHQKHYEKI